MTDGYYFSPNFINVISEQYNKTQIGGPWKNFTPQ